MRLLIYITFFYFFFYSFLLIFVTFGILPLAGINFVTVKSGSLVLTFFVVGGREKKPCGMRGATDDPGS